MICKLRSTFSDNKIKFILQPRAVLIVDAHAGPIGQNKQQSFNLRLSKLGVNMITAEFRRKCLVGQFKKHNKILIKLIYTISK